MQDNMFYIKPFEDPYSGKRVNAISWAALGFTRGAKEMTLNVAVANVTDLGPNQVPMIDVINQYNMTVPRSVLSGDDAGIDKHIVESNTLYELPDVPEPAPAVNS